MNTIKLLAILFICEWLVTSCGKTMDKTIVQNSVQDSVNTVLSQKRDRALTLEEYLDIGTNMDTTAKSYSELQLDSIIQ